MFEPLSLTKLSRKGVDMHEAAKHANAHIGVGKLSPRGGNSPHRRSSSHFREIPSDTIPEGTNAREDSDGDREEEKKEQPAA